MLPVRAKLVDPLRPPEGSPQAVRDRTRPEPRTPRLRLFFGFREPFFSRASHWGCGESTSPPCGETRDVPDQLAAAPFGEESSTACPRPRTRLGVQQLEDRTVPSTLGQISGSASVATQT